MLKFAPEIDEGYHHAYFCFVAFLLLRIGSAISVFNNLITQLSLNVFTSTSRVLVLGNLYGG